MRKNGFHLFCQILFFFIVQSAIAAVPNFTLNVTKTNETCAGNGSLSFTIGNQAPNSTIVFNIFSAPNFTTPIATTSSNSYTGLVAGSYLVVATETTASGSTTQQQNITILNQIVGLQFNLTGQNVICGNDGKITVNVTQGAAVSYEIFSGPVIAPLQPSNVFSNLAAGVYQIRVFDSCGEGVVQTYTIANSTPGLSIQISNSIDIVDCDTAQITQTITHSPSTVFAYPLTVQVTLFPPGGAPIIYTDTFTSGSPTFVQINNDIPLFPGQPYSYNIVVTDGCGNVYQTNGVAVNVSITPFLAQSSMNCNSINYSIWNGASAQIISAPAGYPNPTPFVLPPPQDMGNVSLIPVTGLTPGNYVFSVVDICGITHTLNHTVALPTFGPPSISLIDGCGVSNGSIRVISSSNIVSASIISAPAAYPNTLPFDVTAFVDSGQKNLWVTSVPQGSYTISVTDVCGGTYSVSINVIGYVETFSVEVIENCNSFDLDLHHSGNSSYPTSFWLQKFDATNNTWEHPGTGVVYAPGSFPNNTNSRQLTNNTLNLNLNYSGTFRVLSYRAIPIGLGQATPCFNVLHEFEYSGVPKINDVYTFSCNNNTFDAIVEAVGLMPLIYRITLKDGQPFLVENGNSAAFLGLETGIYNFQVEDACGNILNRNFEVPSLSPFVVSGGNFCQFENAALSVPEFSFLQYQWTKGNDPMVLATTPTLAFTPLVAADTGIYHVQISYPGNPLSCINFELSYEISLTASNPQAGDDTAVIFCGPQGTIDLFSILGGTFDSNGTWTESTTSGMLSVNNWNSANVMPGDYIFQYNVSGTCSADQSVVTIKIKNVPQTPDASVDSILCIGGDFQLHASTVLNATYQWTGPNGFTSTEQNPMIANATQQDSGVYTVKAIENGCESGLTSVAVTLGEFPQFTVDGQCVNNAFTLSVTPTDNSFDPAEVNYAWIGPENFAGSGNPIIITGLASGEYSVTVTAGDDCPTTIPIDVDGTVCGVPKGISPNNDGNNDTWNLAGFGIEKVQIFNRYGMEVYDKANYVDQWYGQDKHGNILPDATYYYLIKFTSGEAKSGWVYLLTEN
jgi:gliding motility-associated-like protein